MRSSMRPISAPAGAGLVVRGRPNSRLFRETIGLFNIGQRLPGPFPFTRDVFGVERLHGTQANHYSLPSEPRCQSLCVEGSVDLGVVVEVNENVKVFGPSFGMGNRFGTARPAA